MFFIFILKHPSLAYLSWMNGSISLEYLYFNTPYIENKKGTITAIYLLLITVKIV